MNILESTRRYEKWLAAHTSVVRPDLLYKHAQMKKSVFPFLRATFYRWVQLWNEHCADLVKAPRVLGVGDLHFENFGTWRDAEGRLIWGVNDFDEACEIPYANDLVRLTVSVHLAIRDQHLNIGRRQASELILEGYSENLGRGGRPFVLDEQHQFLRTIAQAELRDPVHFWHTMRGLPTFRGALSKHQREALELMLPHPITPYRVVTRRAGLGSLGRVRLVALSDWRGGLVAREIKAFLPSAWNFQSSHYSEIITRAVRMPDPFVCICGDWVVRRLAPDCSRIELATLPKRRDEAYLVRAMGSETANIHLSTPEAVAAIQSDLGRRPASWLHDAAKVMSKAVLQDWKVFSGRK